jgi:hypothetical protein
MHVKSHFAFLDVYSRSRQDKPHRGLEAAIEASSPVGKGLTKQNVSVEHRLFSDPANPQKHNLGHSPRREVRVVMR